MSDTTAHDWFAEQIAAYITDGLSGDDLARFRSHEADCRECAAILTHAEQSDAELRGLFRNIEPSAGFEDRLIQGLRQSQKGRKGGMPWTRLRLPNYPRVFRAAAAVAAVVVLGIGGYQASSVMQTGHLSWGSKAGSTISMNAANNLSQTRRAFVIDRPTDSTDQDAQQQMTRATSADSPLPPVADGRVRRWAFPANDQSVSTSGKKTREKDGLTLNSTNTYAGGTTIIGGTLALGNATADGGTLQIGNGGSVGTLGSGVVITNSTLGFDRGDNGTPLGTASGTVGGVMANKSDSGAYAPALSRDDHAMSDDIAGKSSVNLPAEVAAALKKRVDPQGARDLSYYRVAVPEPSSPAEYFKPNLYATAQNSEGQQEGREVQLTDRFNFSASDEKDNPAQPARVHNLNGVTIAADADGAGASDAPPTAGPSTPPVPAPAQSPVASQAPAAVAGRQIIRHGEMSFEVDSFDSAFTQIRKIAEEESGFIASTNSDKLANGKVSGTVTVRVPPDHLDTLILKLRGLGDLKGQKITSDDITREYTDLQSELRAAQAMEDRLLEIIKTGKGEVKDLVEAEKELGSWREKVEQVTGQINYDNNLISLSTLEISVTERDIRNAASANETETVSMGIETPDVINARAAALKAIDDHHGRITLSELKQLEAGELAATINASVAPDDAGPLIDNLRQIGRVARLEMGRQQTTPDGQPVAPGAHLQRAETQLRISIYNLANIQPRQTTNVAMACEDTEAVYHQIIARIDKSGGRVVNSALNRITARQIEGSINFDVPADQADAVLTDIRALGEVMNLSVTENPDAANVTSAKRGFALTLSSFAEIAPRQTIAMTIMPAGQVSDAYAAVQAAAVAAGANVTTAQLQEQNSQSTAATLVFDVSRAHQVDIEKALADVIGSAGRQIARQASNSDDLQHTLAGKVQYSLTFASADALGPRQSIAITLMPAGDLGAAYHAVQSAAVAAGANITTAQLQEQNSQSAGAVLVFDLSDAHQADIEKALTQAVGSAGRFVMRQSVRSNDLDHTLATKVQYALTFNSSDVLNPRQTIERTLALSDVAGSYNSILAAGQQANARVAVASLDQSDPQNPVGHLELIVPRTGVDAVEAAITAANAGEVSRNVARSSDLNSTTEEKTDLRLTIVDVDHLPPRQTTTMDVLVSDPQQRSRDLQAAVLAAGGRVITQTMSLDVQHHPEAHVQIEIPLKSGPEFVDRISDFGTLQSIDQTRDASLPDAAFTHARLEVTFGQETGLWTSVKSGIGASVQGLLYSLELVVIGVCLVLPLAGALWLGAKGLRRLRRKPPQSVPA